MILFFLGLRFGFIDLVYHKLYNSYSYGYFNVYLKNVVFVC